MRIHLSWPEGEAFGVLENNPTSEALARVLPYTSEAHTWGDEVYFSLPVQATLDIHPKQVVPRGTICFWVQGSALAIPYGPTPISVGNECRLVTAVNVLGHLESEHQVLSSIHDGDSITVALVD